MENESLFNERQSIRDSARQLKKYGSTCNHVRNHEYLIRHNLDQSDTLQGIALKYGCTTEQIRRANRLFAQDSLFLRQYLMIPVDHDTSTQYNQYKKSLSFPARDNDLPIQSDQQNTETVKCNDNEATTVLSPEEENKKSIDDFLSKIDLTIAKTKKFVASSHVKNSQSSLNLSDDGSDNAHSSAAYALSTSYQNHNGSYEGNNSNGTQMLAHGRRVKKSSLHRLEEQQDEFYQL